MRIAYLTEVGITPPLGSLLGTSVSSDVLGYLNNEYGNQSGVIFGQPGDPNADRFQHMMQLISNQLVRTEEVIKSVAAPVLDPLRIQRITSEHGLYNTPVSMQLPILMCEPVRQLFMDDRIDGYGFNKEYLPKEDVFGRLINNGLIVYDPDYYPDGKLPEFAIEEHVSTDPNLTFDELDDIEATRDWVVGWLRREMAEGGQMRDPTDPSNKISRPKKKKE